MDVVYIVRPGDDNEELRYSLRSLKNIPHGNVYIAGYMPRWVRNVTHIPVDQGANKSINTTRNLLKAAEHPDISDDFILMNDDFFIMKPINEIPRLNRGPIEKVLDRYRPVDSGYFRGMEDTNWYMEDLGMKNILSYELHVPMVINKKHFLEMAERVRSDRPHISQLHKRTLYGNMFNYGGEQIEDVKIYNYDQNFDTDSLFLSTLDGIWEKSDVGRFIRGKFLERSEYEQ